MYPHTKRNIHDRSNILQSFRWCPLPNSSTSGSQPYIPASICSDFLSLAGVWVSAHEMISDYTSQKVWGWCSGMSLERVVAGNIKYFTTSAKTTEVNPMLFITNRFPKQSFKTTIGRRFTFDLRINAPSNSVYSKNLWLGAAHRNVIPKIILAWKE